jgi:polygalacturonase
LKSRVSLYLDAGATIYANTERREYKDSAWQLINAQKAENISILGPGVLHGQAAGDLGRRPGVANEPRPEFRTGVMLLEDCRHVTLRDFTILYSDSWACHLKRCEKVVVDGLTILNNYFRTNSDGIDPDSCRDVRISNCHITAGDDCICLKTDAGLPCEDIVVTNCTTESVATAIKLGTASKGDFRNIAISNCTVRNSTVGVGFFIKDGGAIDGVTISNLAIETLRNPLEVNAERLRNCIYPIFLDIEKRRDDSKVGAIRNVIFSNIVVRSDNGILIQGMRESAIENLTLQNIVLRVTRGFDYSQRRKHAGGTSNPKDDRITRLARQPSYCTLAHIRNLMVDNLNVQVDTSVLESFPRSALALLNSEGAMLRSIYRGPGAKGGPVLEFSDTREASVTACVAPPGTETFLRLHGMRKDDVALTGNNLRGAKRAVQWE